MSMRWVACGISAALCCAFLALDWTQLRSSIDAGATITGLDFFRMGMGMLDQAHRFNDGQVMAYAWVVIAPATTIIATITIMAGLPSRLFVTLAGLSFVAAPFYVGLMGAFNGGQILFGAYLTAAMGLAFIVTGLAARREKTPAFVTSAASSAM